MNDERRAADSNSTAYYKTHTGNLIQSEGRKPAYYSDFIKCNTPDLIFLTKEWKIINLIRYLGSQACMLCQDPPYLYNLSFCCGKEVWVMYRNSQTYPGALDLAHAAQRNGAKKICLIRIELKSLQEAIHVGK